MNKHFSVEQLGNYHQSRVRVNYQIFCGNEEQVIPIYALMYHIKWTGLDQFSLSGAYISIVKDEMVVQVSGLDFLMEYKVLDSILWNCRNVF